MFSSNSSSFKKAFFRLKVVVSFLKAFKGYEVDTAVFRGISG